MLKFGRSGKSFKPAGWHGVKEVQIRSEHYDFLHGINAVYTSRWVDNPSMIDQTRGHGGASLSSNYRSPIANAPLKRHPMFRLRMQVALRIVP